MTTLYVDHRGAALDSDGASLLVHTGEGPPARLPLGPLERVVVRGDATLSTRLLTELWRRDVGLLTLSGRHSEATARLVGRPHDDAALRLAQYRLAAGEGAWRPRARALVEAKLRAQQRLLERALAQRPDRRYPLTGALDRLAGLLDQLADPGAASSRNEMIGLEGAAAAAYFAAFATLFPARLRFEGRRRRPPPDPVNACLSLGYTLLHHEAVREAQVVGLDPLLGVLHVPQRGRESLACDMVEPLRPHIDEWVWRSFADRTLRSEHFTSGPGGACLMGKAGRQAFYGAFEALAKALRRLLRRMARDLAADLRREIPEER